MMNVNNAPRATATINWFNGQTLSAGLLILAAVLVVFTSRTPTPVTEVTGPDAASMFGNFIDDYIPDGMPSFEDLGDGSMNGVNAAPVAAVLNVAERNIAPGLTPLQLKQEQILNVIALNTGYQEATAEGGQRVILAPGGWFQCEFVTLDAYLTGSDNDKEWWIAHPVEVRQDVLDLCNLDISQSITHR